MVYFRFISLYNWGGGIKVKFNELKYLLKNI